MERWLSHPRLWEQHANAYRAHYARSQQHRLGCQPRRPQILANLTEQHRILHHVANSLRNGEQSRKQLFMGKHQRTNLPLQQRYTQCQCCTSRNHRLFLVWCCLRNQHWFHYPRHHLDYPCHTIRYYNYPTWRLYARCWKCNGQPGCWLTDTLHLHLEPWCADWQSSEQPFRRYLYRYANWWQRL